MCAQQYSDEVKASVVADVLAGTSLRKAAARHGVALTTVHTWKNEAIKFGTEKRASLDTIMERTQQHYYEYIEFVLNATKDIAYIRSQSASDLAVLVGVASDKAERIAALRVKLAEYAQEYPQLAAPDSDVS